MVTKVYSLCAVLLMSACAPVYVPNVRNTPLFRGAGEFQGSVHFGQGVDVQAAVAVSDHIGLMANYNYVNRTGTQDEDSYVKHNIFEGGLGYFNNTGSLGYEFFAGFGRGEGTGYDEYYFFAPGTLLTTGRYNRIFLQPSIGSNHRIFNWIFSARFSILDFTEFERSGQQFAVDLDPVTFIEPSFTGRIFFGHSPVYGQFQAGLSLPVGDAEFVDYEPVYLSIGFGVRLGGKKE